MTNQQGAPEALRLADSYAKAHAMYCMEDLYGTSKSYTAELLKERHAARERLAAALVEAQQPAAHVQNPAGIEHVADDVSKNGVEVNMSTAQPAPAGATPECLTCNDHGAVGNILTAEPCPDCTRWNAQPAPATQQAGEVPSKAYAWVYVNKYGVDSIPASKDWCAAMVSGHGGSMFPLYTAPQPSPTPQADSQPAPDEIVSVAREQGLPETEIEGVFRVNADDLCRVVAADRAARAAPQPATADAVDAQRWRWVAAHWKTVNFKFDRHTQVLSGLSLTVDATKTGMGAPDIEREIDAALAAQQEVKP